MDEGTFEVECNECGKQIELDISMSPKGTERIRVNGRPLRKRPPGVEVEEVEVKATAMELDEKTPNYNGRFKVIMVLFLIIAILGIASSIATVTSSFSIKDLEERSQNDSSSFSVWVIDAGTGRPIEKARVTLENGGYNLSGHTDNEGLVIFSSVRTGPLTITLKAEGYKTTSGEVVIMKGSPNVIDIPMEKGSSSESVPMLTKQFQSEDYTTSYTNIMAAIMFVTSITAVAGAYLVNKKEFFGLTMVIAFLSIFSFGFMIGSILAIVAVILLIISYEGFSHNYNLRMILEHQGREDLKKLFRQESDDVIGLPPAGRS